MNQQVVQQEPQFTLTLPGGAINAILQGLGEIPTKFGMPIANAIKDQMGPQILRLQAQPAPDGAANDGEPPAASADPVAAAAAEATGKKVAKKVTRKRVAARK